MNLWPLYRLLADGQFHSGEALGGALGVSRAAVWKYVQQAAESGIQIESVKGKGYRIPGGLDLLDAAKIRDALLPMVRARLGVIETYEELGSTNSVALQRAQLQPSHGYVCLAEWQTAGRGRRGRSWSSAPASSLCLSLVWEFSGGAAALEGLSLVVGLAVQRALEALGAEGVGLKWPNDLYWGGRKLGGILLEMTGDASGPCQVVIGIGINVQMTEVQSVGIDQPWVALSEVLGGAPGRSLLAAGVLEQVVRHLVDFVDRGFDEFREAWESRDILRGAYVTVSLGDGVLEGVSLGVNAQGALRVLVDGLERVFYAGEVSLRRRM